MGGAAAAGGMDSGGYAALGGDVGAGFDEDAVFSPEALPKATRKVFCNECFFAVARTHPACGKVQKVEQESMGGAADYRGDRGSAAEDGFHPLAGAASEG